MLLAANAIAVPAKPGITAITQSDGSVLHIQALGDEFHHSIITADGFTISRGNDGDFYYYSAQGLTAVKAHDAAVRTTAERDFLAQNGSQFTHEATTMPIHRAMARTAAARRALTQVPTMGSPRVPILLVQYTDKKMSNTKAQITAHYNTDPKSAYQYFADQSNGKYTPQYDIYGIYDLPNKRSVYGGSQSSGDDDKSGLMVTDAIAAAGNDIDWSLYDNDGDGEVDVCIVVYAGVGQAQAYYTVPGSVWPCQWDLTTAASYGDGSGAVTRNGVKIDKYAVFNEVAGSSDSGKTLDGVGTFCHEFSHCLGLPDFYATNYSSNFGMGNWSLMCSGCYNGGTIDGDTPVGYSAYEKAYMGWIDFIQPEVNTKYTLPVFNSKSIDTDQAIKITALNENEYWILENRRKQGWDYYIADEGVLITHFTYIPSRWDENTPNNYTVQLATIIPADNVLSDGTEYADLYGESNHEFTPESSPAMKANMEENGTLASSTGGAGTVDKPVTDINLNADGTASLWYMKNAFAKEIPQLTDTTDITSTAFTAHWNEVENVTSYTLQVSDVSYVPPVALLGSLDGSQYTGSYANITLPAPWGGTNVRGGNGAVYVQNSTNTSGNITYTIPEGYEKATFTVKITTVSSTYGTGNLTVTTPATKAQGHQFAKGETFAWLVTASSGEKITITSTDSSYSPDIALIEVYSGDATEVAASHRATETGDAVVRVITGITGNSYTVENLTENGIYNVKVKAVYIDDSEGDWSTVWTVQLHEQESESLPGDVNLDGKVDIDDVNIIIAIILGKDDAANYDRRAYITDDDTIDVDDVNAVIAIILGK